MWVRRSTYEAAQRAARLLEAGLAAAEARESRALAARDEAITGQEILRRERDEARAAHHRVRTELAEATASLTELARTRPATLADTESLCGSCDTSQPATCTCAARPALEAGAATGMGALIQAARAAGAATVAPVRHDMSDNLALLGPLRDPEPVTPPGGITLPPLPDVGLDGYQAVSDRLVAGLPCGACGGTTRVGVAHYCKPEVTC